MKGQKVAIVGSGLIGRSWSMLFAAAGYDVVLYDVQEGQVQRALEDIEKQLAHLERLDLLRGHLSKEQQFKLISGADSLEACIKDAVYIQECVPERLELKTAVYEQVDKLMSATTILASSASALLPSALSQDIQHKHRFIVAHPTNPPYYAPLVELVTGPAADEDVIPKTRAIMEEIGQVPVVLKKEINGFVLNRMQYAIFKECWRLIRDDVISVEDLDKVMSAGLGRRYAFMGPLETAYLNADGMFSYADRYADMIFGVMNDFEREPEKMEGPVLEKIHDEIHQRIPLDQLQERRQWRDKRLSALSQLYKHMEEDDAKHGAQKQADD